MAQTESRELRSYLKYTACNMYKVFYSPTDYAIKGFSDGEDSMSLPFVETDEPPYILENYRIELIDGVPKLSAIKMQYTDEEWSQLTN